jgi:hypothetical protein
MESRASGGLRSEWLAVAFVEGFDPRRNPEIQNLEQFRAQKAASDRLKLGQQQVVNDLWLQRNDPEAKDAKDILPLFMMQMSHQQIMEAHEEFLRIANHTQSVLDNIGTDLDKLDALLREQRQDLIRNAIVLPDGRIILVGKDGNFYEYNEQSNERRKLEGADRDKAQEILESEPQKKHSTLEDDIELRERERQALQWHEWRRERERELKRLREQEERLLKSGNGNGREWQEIHEKARHLEEQITGVHTEANKAVQDVREKGLRQAQDMNATVEAAERQGISYAPSGIMVANVNPSFNSAAEGDSIGKSAPTQTPSKSPQVTQTTLNFDL